MIKIKYCIFVLLILFLTLFTFNSRAFASTEIFSDIITEDTTWTIDNSPYVINSPILVEEGVTLTIDSGVIVKFDSNGNSIGSLIIDGTLLAQGTKDSPIHFTSNKDDSIGGDTNGDGESSSPSKGDWGEIMFEETSVNSKIENAIQQFSSNGLLLFTTTISLDNFNSDNGINLYFESHGEFSHLSVPEINLYDASIVSLNDSNISGFNSPIIGVYGEKSSLTLTNTTIHGGNSGEAIDIFEGASFYADNLTLDTQNSTGDGIHIYEEGSYLEMNNSKITDTLNALSVYSSAKAVITDSTFICSHDCLTAYVGIISISGSKISGASDAGIISYDGTAEPKNITITKNEIFNNNYGIAGYGAPIIASGNSIHNNIIGAFNVDDSMGDLDFKKNYWGDESGPYNFTTNLDGFGDEVSDNILYTPWLKSDPLIVPKGKTPVIIIPGVMGTQLIKNYGDKEEIWPAITKVVTSITDNFLRDLELLPSGEKNLDFPINIGDIIRNAPSTDVFDGLISELTTTGEYVEGENLFVFPYDWRLSNSTNAVLLKEKIEQILSDTGKEKVDIIAHSMGGLLTKEYIADNGKDKIDNLIFLGTPHLGAPKAFKALVYGDSMGFNIGPLNLLRSKIVKAISQNMPSIYELLPSSKYVSDLRYISEKTFGSDPVYLDYDEIKSLLVKEGINQSLIQSADTFHQNIDDIDLSNIKVSNISACGEPTLSSIEIRKKFNIGPLSFSEDYSLHYANGDETVPLDSSTGILNVDKYFIDRISHSALPSAGDVPSAVLDILGDEIIPTESKVFEDINKCTPINGVILSVHSPISLDIYDTNGNHSGFDENGDIENNILGASYDTIGEAKFAFIPDGVNVIVKGIATDSGSFDLAIEEVVDSKTVETKFWNDVPITSTSQMNFDLNSYNDINSIKVDNKNLLTSNTLSQNEDYLDVPAVIKEVSSHNGGGSYIISTHKSASVIPEIINKKDIIKSSNIKNQKPIKKELAVLNTKESILNQEKNIPNSSNLGASAVNSGHGIRLWDTIRSFFKWLFHIKK